MKDGPRVYRVGGIRIAALCGLTVAAVGGLVYFGCQPGVDANAFRMAELIVGTILAAGTLIVWRTRLELSPEGITLFHFGFRIQSDWAQVSGIVLTYGYEGLYLDRPSATGWGAWSLSVLPVITCTSDDPGALAEGRFINLRPFMTHYWRGPLQADIRTWAPGLPTVPGPVGWSM